MNRRYITVDVFTDQPFGGNPLAVVLDAEGLDTAQMQAIATEFNYSETTFVRPPADPAHTAQIRIFTPGNELPFAGHPNVGTAHVLASEGTPGDTFLFEEAAGLVPVAIQRDAGTVRGAELTAPQALQILGEMQAAHAADCLSLDATDIVGTPVLATVGVAFALVEIRDRDTLRRATCNATAFARHFTTAPPNAIYFYTREPSGGFDIHARMFSPLDGMNEDPATGSASVTLAALLAQTAPDGEHTLRIEQGRDMGRPSTLLTRVVKQHGQTQSAHVGGNSVIMMRGTISA